jgi:hypothetical protein
MYQATPAWTAHYCAKLDSQPQQPPAMPTRPDVCPSGLSYQGKALLSPGSGAPMYFAAPGTPGGRLSFDMSPGPALQLDRPLNLQGSILGSPVRTDSTSTFAYLGTGNGSSTPEQYLAYDPGDPGNTAAILPGGAVILRSKVCPG